MKTGPLVFPLQSVFLALPLEQEAKQTFQNLQHSLLPFAPFLRFQNPATPHLTLYFWKEVMAIEYRDIERAARKIATNTASFSLQCTGVSTFRARGKANVLFMEVAFSEELARMKKQCPWPNLQPFAPHITVARITHPDRFAVERKKVEKALYGCSFPIMFNSLRLYAEVDGVKQSPIGKFVFGNVITHGVTPEN
ncbi:hypothetical protein COU76_05530 [Candidatus Peregrinibacteria bacterium CG10_big_fil_rev_8_21_14_0_10_49_10]|nr:MAG: hypothetical protein COU76_05530 [Candidatus Peregrinibacteria bacterium CG10_big_fil_rev_8_21_14_0_10_49_10]